MCASFEKDNPKLTFAFTNVRSLCFFLRFFPEKGEMGGEEVSALISSGFSNLMASHLWPQIKKDAPLFFLFLLFLKYSG